MKARLPARGAVAAAAGQVRIIGGQWRGTRLAVPTLPGLRPTSDRARETLFNWLVPVLPGARVLDLFAGTGALGLEALSRGAASAVFVERDAVLANALRGVVARLLPAPAASIVQGDALQWLASAEGEFDIAFVDPPFADDLWQRTLAALAPRMAADAWLYMETPAHHPAPPGPCWLLHRESATREARHRLFRRTG